MRGWAGRSGDVLLDADLLESALLSPVSFAEAEAAVLAATSGPDGVLVASVVWEADAVTIRVAVRATQLTDELVARTWEVLDHQLGVTVGFTVAAGAPALVLPAAGLALLWTQLPPDTPGGPAGQEPRRAAGVAGRPPGARAAPRQRRRRPPRRTLGRPHARHAGRPVRRPPAGARHRVGGGVAGGALRRRTAPDDAHDPRHPRLRHRARGPGRAGAAPRAGRRPARRRRRGPDDHGRPTGRCGTSSTCRGPTT